MPVTLLLGGAASGKSSLAVRLAVESGRPVTLIATAEGRDEEMAARIEAHRRARPEGWTIVEEPLELASAIEAAEPEDCLVLDCLTLWISNLIGNDAGDADVENASGAAIQRATGRPGPSIVVSNEVGSGIVPVNPLGRRYRDLLGSVNASWAKAADRTLLCVAGHVLSLRPIEEVRSDG